MSSWAIWGTKIRTQERVRTWCPRVDHMVICCSFRLKGLSSLRLSLFILTSSPLGQCMPPPCRLTPLRQLSLDPPPFILFSRSSTFHSSSPKYLSLRLAHSSHQPTRRLKRNLGTMSVSQLTPMNTDLERLSDVMKVGHALIPTELITTRSSRRTFHVSSARTRVS